MVTVRNSSLGSWTSFSSSDWSKDNDAALSLADMKLGWYIGTLPHPRVQLAVSAYFIRTHTYLLITPRLAITTPPLCRHKTHHPLSKQYQQCQMLGVIKLLHNQITRIAPTDIHSAAVLQAARYSHLHAAVTAGAILFMGCQLLQC